MKDGHVEPGMADENEDETLLLVTSIFFYLFFLCPNTSQQATNFLTCFFLYLLIRRFPITMTCTQGYQSQEDFWWQSHKIQ